MNGAGALSARAGRVALGALLGGGACVVALHLLRDDLDPVAHRLSEYATGPYGVLMTSAFWLLGVALLALAVALRSAGAVEGWARHVPLLVAVAGIGILLAGVFPTDDRVPSSPAELVHSLASGTAALALILAALLSWAGRPRPGPAPVPLGLALVAVATGIASRVLHDTRWAGLGQRALWVVLVAWLLGTAWQLARRGTAAGARPRNLRRVVSAVVSLALVAGTFLFVLPQVADFREVWAAATDMTRAEVASLALAAGWNIATYLFVMVAVLPGLTYWQAFVVGQSSTAIATALPAGSALGVGVTYMMYSSFGRSGEEIGLAAVLTGLWNNFVKLGLPVVALAILALTGETDAAQVTSAAIGLGLLLATVGGFALMLRSDDLARRVGAIGGRLVSSLRRLVGRPPVTGWEAGAVRFRGDTIHLLRDRWRRLTVATLVSHLSLFFVLLLALRHMDVSQAQVSWAEALAAFALVRLVTALPITPGGVGPVELLLVGALVLAGGARAGVVAAVLIYRFLTLVVQVPIGGLSYLLWRRRRPAAQPT